MPQNFGRRHRPAKVAKAAKPGSALPRQACHQDASAPHFADQAFDKLFTANRIPGSQLLQDGPWHDNPPVRSPFQEVQQAAAPARPGITAGAQFRLDRLSPALLSTSAGTRNPGCPFVRPPAVAAPPVSRCRRAIRRASG